jgi:NADH-quinone oxidoreductase subunit C
VTPRLVFDELVGRFGDAVFEMHDDPKRDKDPWFRVVPDRLADVARVLRDEPRYACDWLECVTGTDYPKEKAVRVTYHFYSYALRHRVVLKVDAPYDAPNVPSLVSLYPVADWQERECFDLLGVRFDGHPNLARILLPDDWVGHPLRKDFAEASDYHGIPTSRPVPLELLQLRVPMRVVRKGTES